MNDLVSGFILGAVGLPVARAFVRGLIDGPASTEPDQDPGGDRRVEYPRVWFDGREVPGARSVTFHVEDGPPWSEFDAPVWGAAPREISVPVRVTDVNLEALRGLVEEVPTAASTRGNSRGLDPAKICVFSGPPAFDNLVAASTGPAVYKLVHDPGGSLEFTNASQIDFEGIPDGTVVSHLGIVAGDRIHYSQPLARPVVASGMTCVLAPGDFHFIQRPDL